VGLCELNVERQHSNTYCNFDTAKLKDLTFLFVRQRKLWNDVQLRIAMVTRFSWYFATNTTGF